MKIYFDYLLIKMFYLSAILNLRELDSIAVSVFADVFIELTNTVMAAGEESFMCLSSMKSA